MRRPPGSDPRSAKAARGGGRNTALTREAVSCRRGSASRCGAVAQHQPQRVQQNQLPRPRLCPSTRSSRRWNSTASLSAIARILRTPRLWSITRGIVPVGNGASAQYRVTTTFICFLPALRRLPIQRTAACFASAWRANHSVSVGPCTVSGVMSQRYQRSLPVCSPAVCWHGLLLKPLSTSCCKGRGS